VRIQDRVEVRNQALALTVPLPGSGLSLNYRSDRGPGRRASYRTRLPLEAPGGVSVESWDVSVQVAGRALAESIDGSVGAYEFDWDGRDAAGEYLGRTAVALLEARPAGSENGAVARRRVRLGRPDPRSIGLGGWTLSVHDLLDEGTGRVAPGSGGRTQRAVGLVGGDGAPVESTDDETLCPRGGGRSWAVFGPDGHRRVVDPRTGTVLWQFEYDEEGFLASATDRIGRTTRLVRDGTTVNIQSPTRGLIALSIGADGWLAGMTTAAGTSATLQTERDLLVGWVDGEGRQSIVGYGSDGRLASIARPAGPSFDLTRTVDGRRTRITKTSHSGREASWVTDRLDGGALRRETNCCGNATALVTERDQRRDVVSRPDGTKVTRSGRGTADSPRRTVVETPGGITTVDAVVRTTDPATGVVTETRDTNGRIRSTRFDPGARRISAETPAGRKDWLELDDVGRLVRSGFDETIFRAIEFDDAGRPRRIISTDEAVETAFDAAGLPAGLSSSSGETAVLSHDADARLVRQEFEPGVAVGIGYDATDNVTAVTPPGRPATSFTYDTPGVLTSIDYPAVNGERATLRYTYDDDGHLIHVARADGRAVDLAWDLGGRITEIRTAEGDLGLFTYDEDAGRLIRTETRAGDSHRFGWDGHLPVSVEATGAAPGRFRHRYDENQQIVATEVDGADAVIHEFDADGLLTAVGPLRLERDGHGNVVRRQLGACGETIERDGYGRVVNRWVTAADREILATSYTYEHGRLTKAVERLDGELVEQQYRYDVHGRLVEHVHSGFGSTTYGYDENGNRTQVSGPGGDSRAEVDARDRLVSAGGASYRYNLDGELEECVAADGTTTWQFDALGRVVGAVAPDGRQVVHHLDGFGRRIASVVDGEPVQRFLHASAYPLAQVDAAGQPHTLFLRRRTYGAPDALLRGADAFLVVADHVGSPRLVIDGASGEIAQRLDLDAWGRVLADSSPGFQPFGFAGGVVDPVTGLVHFGARDYDPATGRWLSTDPKIFLGGGTPNLYCYADNDPVNKWDPTGADVYRCESLSKIGWQKKMGLKHEWIKTDTVEAGLGPHPAREAGNTAVTDQSGSSESRADTTCERIEDVDEECVNEQLATPNTANGMDYGRDLGWYSPINQCQSFVEDVLSSCGTAEGWDDYTETGDYDYPVDRRWDDYSPEMDYSPDPGFTPADEKYSDLWD
jgi:RHS repeat-associated protein